MTFFDPLQLRAAIALTGMQEGEFALAVPMRRATLAEILNGHTTPREDTARAIMAQLAKAGVELLPDSGVRKRPVYMQHYEGADGWRRFSEDRYQTALADPSREFLSCGGSQDDFIRATGEEYFNMHAARMAEIKGFSMRALRPMSNTKPLTAAYINYRALPDSMFPDSTTYVYGNKTAFITHQAPTHIFVIENVEISNSFRKQFEAMWQTARAPRSDKDAADV